MTYSKIHTSYSGYLSLGLIGLYLLVNLDVLQDLLGKWLAQGLTGTYSHGPLLALVVVYLIYKKIRQLRPAIALNPSGYGLGVLLLVQFMLLLAKLIDVNFMQHLLLVIAVLAIVWSLHSFAIARHFLLPAGLFVLSFPVWGALATVLQNITVQLTNLVLGLSSIPYYRVNEFFHLPNGIFEVADSCSGLQQFLVAIIIGLLYIAPYNVPLFQRIRVMAYIILLAVILNTVRVVTIIFIGYFTEMRSSLVEEHVMLGWVIFGIGMFGFLYLYDRRQAPTELPFTLPAGFHAQSRVVLYAPLVTLLAILAPHGYYLHVENAISTRQHEALVYQISTNDWQRLAADSAVNWEPVYPAGDELLRETHRYRGRTVYLYINRFTHRHADAEPINMTPTVYDKRHWAMRENQHVELNQANGRSVSLPLYVLESKHGREQLQVLTWYVVNGKVTHDLLWAKLYQLTGLLTSRYDVKVIAAATQAGDDPQTARDTLLHYFRDLHIH